jgi:hypothetical protein
MVFFWPEQLPMTQHSPGLVRFLRGGGLVALLGAALCGCRGFKTGTVTGKVTVNGTPANAGTVYFQLAAGKQSMASIEPDGSYRAAVPLGKVTVTVQEAPPPVGQKAVPIPAKYANAKTSGFEFDITGNQVIDLDLTGSAPKTSGPKKK